MHAEIPSMGTGLLMFFLMRAEGSWREKHTGSRWPHPRWHCRWDLQLLLLRLCFCFGFRGRGLFLWSGFLFRCCQFTHPLSGHTIMSVMVCQTALVKDFSWLISNVLGPTLRKRGSRFKDVATDVTGVFPLMGIPPSLRR